MITTIEHNKNESDFSNEYNNPKKIEKKLFTVYTIIIIRVKVKATQWSKLYQINSTTHLPCEIAIKKSLNTTLLDLAFYLKFCCYRILILKIPIVIQELNLSFDEINKEGALAVVESVRNKDNLEKLDLNGKAKYHNLLCSCVSDI